MDQGTLLADYRNWLLKVAGSMTHGEENIQDLAQEGWIAMWRATKTYDESKGALPSWLTTAARMRMSNVVTRGTFLGRPEHRGKPTVHEEPVDEIENLMRAQLEDQIDLAYHDGEIMAAVNDLTPLQRQYVYRRFWLDESPTALANDLGNGWVGARPKLRERLAHLDGQTEA